VVQTQDDLGALLHAAEAEIERLRHDVERYMQIANDAINGVAQAPPRGGTDEP
jgi:hypothetical protein